MFGIQSSDTDYSFHKCSTESDVEYEFEKMRLKRLLCEKILEAEKENFNVAQRSVYEEKTNQSSSKESLKTSVLKCIKANEKQSKRFPMLNKNVKDTSINFSKSSNGKNHKINEKGRKLHDSHSNIRFLNDFHSSLLSAKARSRISVSDAKSKYTHCAVPLTPPEQKMRAPVDEKSKSQQNIGVYHVIHEEKRNVHLAVQNLPSFTVEGKSVCYNTSVCINNYLEEVSTVDASPVKQAKSVSNETPIKTTYFPLPHQMKLLQVANKRDAFANEEEKAKINFKTSETQTSSCTIPAAESNFSEQRLKDWVKEVLLDFKESDSKANVKPIIEEEVVLHRSSPITKEESPFAVIPTMSREVQVCLLPECQDKAQSTEDVLYNCDSDSPLRKSRMSFEASESELMIKSTYEHLCLKENVPASSDAMPERLSVVTRDVAVQFNPRRTSSKGTSTMETKTKVAHTQCQSLSAPTKDASVQVLEPTSRNLIDASIQFEARNADSATQTDHLNVFEQSVANTSVSSTPISENMFIDDLLSEGEIALPWNLRLLCYQDKSGLENSNLSEEMSNRTDKEKVSLSDGEVHPMHLQDKTEVNNSFTDEPSDTSTKEKDYSLSEGEIPPNYVELINQEQSRLIENRLSIQDERKQNAISSSVQGFNSSISEGEVVCSKSPISSPVDDKLSTILNYAKLLYQAGDYEASPSCKGTSQSGLQTVEEESSVHCSL